VSGDCTSAMPSAALTTALFFFYGSGDHRDLHSFPTRRSSDLGSSKDSLDLLRDAGVDLTTAAPYDAAFATMEEYLNTLEEALSEDRKSTRLNSSHVKISYAVFCLKKKKKLKKTKKKKENSAKY